MEDIQKLKSELDKYKKEVKRLEKSLEIANYWNDKRNIDELTIRATNQSIEIEELKRKLKTAEHFNDLNNVNEVTLRATQRGIIIEKQENEIRKLKDENKDLKLTIQKLKNENGKLKSNSVGVDKRPHNERGAGRKERFSAQEKEMMKMYRIQGKTIKEISQMYSCSVGLIHKIINE